MAKQSPSEQLDLIITRLLGRPDAPLPRDDSRSLEAHRGVQDDGPRSEVEAQGFSPANSPGVFPGASAPEVELIFALRDLPRPDFRARLKADLERRASMAGSAPAQPAPETRATVTPYLSVRGAAAAIEFYKKAFGATEVYRLTQPDGRIGHATIDIAGAKIYLADEFPEAGFKSPETLGGSPIVIHLDVPDVDALGRQAVAAGATVLLPIADQFYGARSGQFRDPFGHTWTLSTNKETVSPEEMQRRNAELSSRHDAEVDRQAEPPGAVNFIRKGFHTVTPYLIIPGAARWIDFMKQAFGAEEKFRAPRPGTGGIMHAELQLGDSMIELADANDRFPAVPMTLLIRSIDPDASYDRAIAAGAHPVEPVKDQGYGTRAGTVRDGSGNNLHIFMPLPGDKIFQEFRSVTPHLYADNAPALIEFLEKAFGGKEVYRAQLPDGNIPHAQVRIGDSLIALAGSLGRSMYPIRPSIIHLYVPDTDAVYEPALRAGAESIQPPSDQPYGDRSAGVRDPFGNQWFIATHVRDVAP